LEIKKSQLPLQLELNNENEQQNQEINNNGDDKPLKKFLQGNVFSKL